MAVVSGIGMSTISCKMRVANACTACTFGASIICVDLVIRQIPGHRNFKIEDSNAFLSTGLSLSFGVMVGSPSNVPVLFR